MSKVIMVTRTPDKQKMLLQVDRIIICATMPGGTLIKYNDNYDNYVDGKVPADWFEAYYAESIEQIYKMINE